MSNKFSSLNEFLESLLDGREIQLKYDGKEYCIFNIGADNSVEKAKYWWAREMRRNLLLNIQTYIILLKSIKLTEEK